jgi:hypothetical protein
VGFTPGRLDRIMNLPVPESVRRLLRFEDVLEEVKMDVKWDEGSSSE